MSRVLSRRHLAAAAVRRSAPLAFGSRWLHTPAFATVSPQEVSGSSPAEVQNFVQGKWTTSANWNWIVDPLNGEKFIKIAEVQGTEIKPFVDSLSSCPKHGLHNPLKDPERYLMYGDISAKAAHMLGQPAVSDFFAKLIQRVSPKSYQQALLEVQVSQKFLENFCGDQVRFLARSFAVPGNHLGQMSNGYRWPYGPVAIITPFNFSKELDDAVIHEQEANTLRKQAEAKLADAEKRLATAKGEKKDQGLLLEMARQALSNHEDSSVLTISTAVANDVALRKSHLPDLDVELLRKDFAVDEAEREELTSGAYDAAHEFALCYDFSSLAESEDNDSPRNL